MSATTLHKPTFFQRILRKNTRPDTKFYNSIFILVGFYIAMTIRGWYGYGILTDGSLGKINIFNAYKDTIMASTGFCTFEIQLQK